jgi:hypothetical protein
MILAIISCETQWMLCLSQGRRRDRIRAILNDPKTNLPGHSGVANPKPNGFFNLDAAIIPAGISQFELPTFRLHLGTVHPTLFKPLLTN